MRIFVLSELYYPAETGTGFMMGKIAEGLATRYPVHVLCAYPSTKTSNRTQRIENRNGVTVERCVGTKLNKDVIWSRILNMVTISFSIFFKAISRLKPGDKVLVVTNPPSLPFFASIACKIRRAKCYLLIYDLYPEVLTTTGLLNADSFIARFLSWLNTWMYRQMDKVIVLGRDMDRIVARRFHPSNRRTVITNWADVDEIVPLPRDDNSFLKQLSIMDKFVVQYSGNMGRTHGVEVLLEAAKRLDHRDDVHFLLVGTGAKRQWLEDELRKSKLRNVTMLPLQPRQALCELLNACDVAVISFIPGMAGVSVPSRMYTIMSAGKPIIAVADEDSELALVVREERIGWIVPPERSDLLTELILKCKSEPDVVREMGRRARMVAEQKYSFKKILESYQNLFSNY